MHTLPLTPASPPLRRAARWSLWRPLARGAAPVRQEPPPLPADWDHLDPDQRVRRLGEW